MYSAGSKSQTKDLCVIASKSNVHIVHDLLNTTCNQETLIQNLQKNFEMTASEFLENIQELLKVYYMHTISMHVVHFK